VSNTREAEREGIGSDHLVHYKLTTRMTVARPPLATPLDIIKFICKDLFLHVYAKGIDNLRTNHKGTFVLQSHALPPLIPLSSYRGPANDLETAKLVRNCSSLASTSQLTQQHLIFPQALIQGAVTRLGMPAIVQAESSGLPQCEWGVDAFGCLSAALGNRSNGSH
jgi:hypothetical protein